MYAALRMQNMNQIRVQHICYTTEHISIVLVFSLLMHSTSKPPARDHWVMTTGDRSNL